MPLEQELNKTDKLLALCLASCLAGFIIGFALGWLTWEDNNVTPLEKPECEVRKGYYTVLNLTKNDKFECGLVKNMYLPYVKE